MLQEFFNLLDLPGSSVRDLAGGENPFDQWASPLSGEHRLSGAQLVSRYTGASPDSWGSTLAGFGAEMFLDPTNLVGGMGLLKKALATRKLNALGNWTDGGRVFAADARPAGQYGYVNPKAVEAELITDPIRSSPLREDFGQRRIPQMESDYETLWHGTGKDWTPEPDFPQGRPRADKLLTGTGGAREGPGLYTAQRRSIGEHYFDMLAKSVPGSNTVKGVMADGPLQTWAKRVIQRADPEDPRRAVVRLDPDSGYSLHGSQAHDFNDPWENWEKANQLHTPLPQEQLSKLNELKNRATQLQDELRQELGLPAGSSTEDYRMEMAKRWEDPLSQGQEFSPESMLERQLLHGKIRYLDRTIDDFQGVLNEALDSTPVQLPSVIRDRAKDIHKKSSAERESGSLLARTGGLYKLAVPKKKLDKFMYGDKPVAKAVAHIPEAANYPLALQDVTNEWLPTLTGSRSVYHGDNRHDLLKAIARNFGIENPTGADAQRILTETFGISGNKYLDAASRTSADAPTYNHVIWDPEILENIRVRSVTRVGPGGERVTIKEPFNRMLHGGSKPRPSASSSPLSPVDNWQSGTQVNQLPPTWSPGTERLLNRKAAATLALYNMAARQGGYTVE